MQEIGQYDLLDAEDEVRLFKIIENGINAYKEHGFSPEHEQDLIDLVIARQVVYVSNLRLVIGHAKKRAFYSSMDLLDLIQEGNIGIADAIDRFDYSKGFKFSTFATWYVRQTIDRAISNQSRTIRIPVHVHDKLIKLSVITRKLTVKLDREPNAFEIAEEMGTSAEEVIKLQSHNNKQPVSLNAPIEGIDEKVEFGDSLEDREITMDRALQEAEDAQYISKIFSHKQLDLREKYILSFRLGLEVDELKGTSIEVANGSALTYEQLLDHILSDNTITLEDAGNYFGVTRERIRQIEASGLKKIRDAYHSR